MASGTLCVILTLETKSGRRQNPVPSLLFQKINLFALLYYSIHLLARGKVSHQLGTTKRENRILLHFSVNFCHRFLDSLSPVDAILTLGGRYSLPAHMLSHGRKNTSKKNKELCSFQLSYLAKMRDLLLYILSIFYCFQCSICQIFSVYTFVVLKTEFLDTLRYSGFEVSKTSSLALITLFAPFSALCTQRVITIKKSTVLVKWRLTGRKGEQTKPNFQFP